MSKINHTTGPWEVHEGDDYIVVLRGDETTEQGIRVDNIEDARLIAAAPDLLAALEAVQDDLDLLSNLPGGSSELQFMVEHAIAKAKGESL